MRRRLGDGLPLSIGPLLPLMTPPVGNVRNVGWTIRLFGSVWPRIDPVVGRYKRLLHSKKPHFIQVNLCVVHRASDESLADMLGSDGGAQSRAKRLT